ncbi:ferredoxin [Nocardia cyriacigeorgica]|uniref:ferredoxin n=1 Tax=Nocardia cyriacigeorgica TaxID=135487 RepID=UPI00245524BE|nr:ferredoxin [Nocardia cyriacigeorgica]
MKVVVDRDKCAGLGICEATAPEVFEVGGNGEVVVLAESVDSDRLDIVRSAVESCPTEALRLVDE